MQSSAEFFSKAPGRSALSPQRPWDHRRTPSHRTRSLASPVKVEVFGVVFAFACGQGPYNKWKFLKLGDPPKPWVSIWSKFSWFGGTHFRKPPNSQWILPEQHSRGVSAWDETIDRNQGATACHVSPPESRASKTCWYRWVRDMAPAATNVHSTSKIQVLCLSTLYTPSRCML